MQEIIETSNAPAPIGPYSQGVRANGFIFVSGQIPVQAQTGLVVGGNVAEQTRQVMKNITEILAAAGRGLDSVVKTTVFLAHLEDFPEFNRVYEEYFAEAKPARATVQVAGLPKKVLVEIEVIATA